MYNVGVERVNTINYEVGAEVQADFICIVYRCVLQMAKVQARPWLEITTRFSHSFIVKKGIRVLST